MLDESGVPINGSCVPGFERVRDAFESNFAGGDEGGAAVAVLVEGDLVVNLWGGFADAAGFRPWRKDTLTSIYSGTKGLTSTCIHMLTDRGELDLVTHQRRRRPVAPIGSNELRQEPVNLPPRQIGLGQHGRDLLEVAIAGKGAFRRFKDVLVRAPAERERWFRFRDERVDGRIREWLADNDIEIVGSE